MFRAQRKTNGKDTIKAIMMAANATFRLELKNTNEMINAAIPIATFNP